MDTPHYLTTAEADFAALTPVMRQVVDAKRQHPDALILFRLGDFYELFFEDALEGSRLFDLTLTSRNRNDPRPIPMCGFPYHALAPQVQKALEAGRRCAVVEQLEDPSQAKGIVARGVTHVLTPGVVLETEALDVRRDNHLMALVPGRKTSIGGGLPWGLAVADASTGALRVGEVQHDTALGVLLTRLEPRELVLPPGAQAGLDGLKAADGVLRTERPLPAGSEGPLGDLALGLLRAYLQEVRPSATQVLAAPQPLDEVAHLQLGREAVLHLELLATARLGKRQGSLLHAVDRTLTSAGARLLRALLLAPLADRLAIEARHLAVQALVDDRPAREQIRSLLRHIADVARIATRARAGLAVPRELAVLRDTLGLLPGLRTELQPLATIAPALEALRADLDGADDLHATLLETLADQPRPALADGGVIRPGHDARLDELVTLAEHSQEWLARFEADERQATGLATLRVTYNRVTGYGIEITRAKADHVPAHYHRKQTLKNTERYTTDALVDFERRMLSSESDRLARETDLYVQLCQHVGQHAPILRRMAHALAELDVHAGFAELAASQGYVRPRLSDTPMLHLRGGRHPVVEQMLPAGSFVPNDLALQGDPTAGGGLQLEIAPAQVLLLTGPNMAGKSTLMRQAALAAILAQAGGFVPADEALLGVLDAVLTRIGAGDDIAEGASTFMVEMRETAELLQRATPRTLVLLDEIGRGTSTWDGLAIAWAVVEALHDQARCLCLFATHYHELTALSERLPRLRNAHVAVREWGHDIVFVHRLQPGPTSRSHGIAVARLAGLPAAVVERARKLLEQLEKSGRAVAEAGQRSARQLGLFEAPAPAADPRLQALAQALAGVDPDDLSPRQAHARLQELVEAARGLVDTSRDT